MLIFSCILAFIYPAVWVCIGQSLMKSGYTPVNTFSVVLRIFKCSSGFSRNCCLSSSVCSRISDPNVGITHVGFRMKVVTCLATFWIWGRIWIPDELEWLAYIFGK